ncbi:IS1 family transposase [Cesiribacter sp. SM1]|uniref:IS1 family transposase n=1 Tax=Cesiribacter sp. SM1 TaxID=2861196 RepID=UPI001CD4FD42
MNRRTRQIVAFFIGDRSKASCQELWKSIPQDYQHCYSYSDFLEAYQQVFGSKKHTSVGKDSGETNHVERFNCTIRQRVCRYVRKTLSFSKSDTMHFLYTKLFIFYYNESVKM